MSKASSLTFSLGIAYNVVKNVRYKTRKRHYLRERLKTIIVELKYLGYIH